MGRDDGLGGFLRARREAVSPGSAGLPAGGDRRVPGLRRAEVALLAGVSADYYTRLEQGRERHPTEQILDALARTLQLDADASAHLFLLARPAPRAAARTSPTTVSAPVRALLEHVVDAPACVLGPALDVLAANAQATALYSGFARLDNILRMVFLDPAATEFYADWEHAARGAVASFRASSASFPDDPRVTAVAGELSVRSPAFAAAWVRQEVRPRPGERKHLRHPHVGDLHLHYQGLSITDAPGQQLFVYSAVPGSPSADGLSLLRRLATEPAAAPGAPPTTDLALSGAGSRPREDPS